MPSKHCVLYFFLHAFSIQRKCIRFVLCMHSQSNEIQRRTKTTNFFRCTWRSSAAHYLILKNQKEMRVRDVFAAVLSERKNRSGANSNESLIHFCRLHETIFIPIHHQEPPSSQLVARFYWS